MARQTLHTIIIDVLTASNQALTIDEILNAITSQNLYAFNTKDPRGVVSKAVRRRTVGSPTCGPGKLQAAFEKNGTRKFKAIG